MLDLNSRLVAEIGRTTLALLLDLLGLMPGGKGLADVLKKHLGRLERLPSLSEPIDTRIAKIDSARSGLVEALSAMDELKERAEANKRDLEYLQAQISHAESRKQNVSGELQALKGMAALDSEAVRRALRLPTRVSVWTERVLAFGFGVISSIVASYLYDFFVKPHL